MIDSGKAPPGVLYPKSLPKEGLYALDVDSPIWDDVGLNDAGSDAVPAWLGDDEVRQGIPAWLTIQRCDEELIRLKKECANLQRWAKREWDELAQSAQIIGICPNITCISFDSTDLRRSSADKNVQFYLDHRITELRKLIAAWKTSVRTVCPETYALCWGPTDLVNSAPRDPAPSEAFEDDGGDEEHNSDSDDESALAVEDRILKAMEEVNLTENMEDNLSTTSEGMGYLSDDGYDIHSSPRKRSRKYIL